MNVEPLVYWFPIIIAAAACGRAVPRRHALGLGLCCAGFWMVLALTVMPDDVVAKPLRAVVLLLGALPIAFLPPWVASWEDRAALPGFQDRSVGKAATLHRSLTPDGGEIVRLGEALEQFRDWLDRRPLEPDPWTDFGEWLRSVLYRLCGATHVRLYRLVPEQSRLIPIREVNEILDEQWPDAREGLLGHISTTGRSYFQGDMGQGELIERLASEADPCPQWCFAIRSGPRRLGLVVVGGFDAEQMPDRTLCRTLEFLVEQVWNRLLDVQTGRAAGTRDPVSGVLSRQSFLAMGEVVVREALAEGRPASVAIVAIEGLRQLNDTGRWELADELIREAGAALTKRLRADDLIGRFDGSRFMILLHDVDSHLASLILRQALDHLESLCGDQARWRVAMKIRCGLAGSGHQQPTLQYLISRALRLNHQARGDQRIIASDLEAVQTPEPVSA